MKNIKLQAKFLNLLIIISTLLVFSKGEIIDNPISISDNANPIMFINYGYLDIITSGGVYLFDEEGRVEEIFTFSKTYSAPYTLIYDEHDERAGLFIFTNNEYFTFGDLIDGEIQTIDEQRPTGAGITYPNSDKHIGSIIEYPMYDEGNCKCGIEGTEVIIYGRYSEKNNNNYLSFTFLKQQKSYNIKIDGTLEDKIECKLIDSRTYICAIVQGNQVKICFFGYIKKDGVCGMNNVYERTIEQMSKHTYVELYEPPFPSNYFLCAKNKNTNNIECLSIWLMAGEYLNLCQEQTQLDNQFSSILQISNILFSIPTSSANEQDCAFSFFPDELLFCCGDNDFIQCSRFSTENGNLISSYKLSLPGLNSKLSIFNPNPYDYVYFIFSNKNSDKTKVYQYFIYFPSCSDFTYTIIVHHSLNEKKQDTEKVDLNKLFERKTNTNYYVEFDTLPDEYGDLKVNGEKIISEKNTKILIEKDNTYILDFNSTNDNSVDNFQINYRILIEENYSATCSIHLTILPCYDSCAECSKERDSSSSDEHNCLEDKCKSGYYPSPLKVTNCIKLEEKEINWYLDSETKRFALCNEACKSCNGPNSNITTNCDTCANSELYLLDGNCIATCPEGYYHTVSNDIKVCKKCYKNCLNCTEGEIYSNSVLTDMNCLYCKKGEDPNDSNNLIENQIKIDNNCFPIIIYTNEKLTFNTSDMSSGEIEKSCFDYGKAIISGKYECIEKPTNYFYVVQDDNNTGIIELCDEACSTCTWGKNNLTNNTNCINCTEGYFKTQDSNTNCILESLIPENYLKNDSDNIYYKCHSNCKTCNDYYNFAENDMHCTQCPNDFYYVYGTNNCYNMSFVDENSYYFSKEDNKYHQCYLNCLRCSQPGSDENNQNCDKCISGFYFKNGTQNCYNNSILENGYYLDNFTISPGEDATYKKCYENCKTCNNTITNNSNMNCISCKDNLYKINGTNNCYNETLKTQGYYLKENIFYPCEDNCKTCSDSKTEINGTISNNCLSCDYSTKYLYLVSTLKNCEPEEFKEKGYYLAQDPNNSNTKIFYECYFSCALCDKGKESSNHNCLSCRENFYPKKDDINTKNCYNETEMIPQGYVLINNYWTFYNEIKRRTRIIGFSNSKNSESRRISFIAYFYDENSLTDYVYLDFPVEIETKTNEINKAIYEITKQKNEANANCEKIEQKNKNIHGYNCEVDAQIDNRKSAVRIVDTSQFRFSTLNGTYKYFSVEPSPLAKKLMNDLQNIPEIFDALIDSNLYILEHSKIEASKSLYFNISGIIEENPKIQKTNIKLMASIESENEDLLSEINCTIIDIINNNYKFNCQRKKGEKFDLDNSLFITNDDIILINFDNTTNTTTINYEDSETTSNRIYLSKKKEGLSTGTIVAIALVLAFAIAFLIVAMIYLRKVKPEGKKEFSSSVVNIKKFNYL